MASVPIDRLHYLFREQSRCRAISETSKHALTEQVVHEFQILKKLEHYTKTDGLEDYIHHIIFPKQVSR